MKRRTENTGEKNHETIRRAGAKPEDLIGAGASG